MRGYLHLVAVLMLVALSRAEVRVWEGTLTLPTYEEGMPDPNPPFDQFTNNKFNYPYVLRDNLTSRRSNHDWRAVYLENEYLKCSVLPDIGGHLYTCIDKISGKSMFYDNSAIKKAAVGYRGAWAAFGIEFNFPVSHNWVSMSPVDYAFHGNTDGSASVIVGNVDRVYGMEWTVELVLRPKSTLLEERVTLSNRSDVRHRFYWWNNAGVRVWDDSHIVYPMRFAASHGFTDVVRWPVDEDGHDLSIIHNHVHGAVSLFTHGSRESFMGVWNPSTRTGTVHFAEYEHLPAKKIWSWGVDAEGMDWRKALSDDNSAYIEVQAGLFRNQETYAFLDPRQTIRFSEYWMPVREIGGISRANLAGVLNLSRGGNRLFAGFNPNSASAQSTITILAGEAPVFSEKVDLDPQHPWTHELAVDDPQAKYTIEIRDSHRSLLMRHTEGEYDWTPESEIHVGAQDSHRVPDPERRSCDDWIQFGNDLELNGKNLQALETYQETHRRFPDSFAALKSVGRLNASLLRFQEAKKLLEQASARETSDAEISYYLGIAYDGLGKDRNARTAFENAERLPGFRSAAALRLGELLARQGDLAGAEDHLNEAALASPNDARALEELVAIKFARAEKQEGRIAAEQGMRSFPLSYLLKEELGNPDLKQLGNDANRVLNLAAEYLRLGLYQQALTVLSRDYPKPEPDQIELGALPPDRHPMVAYFRGYCREHLGQSGSSDYQAAGKLSSSYVFPSTTEELAVLSNVVHADPENASAHYLLGTLYFSRGMTHPALEEWNQARKMNSGIPVLNASLGLALLHEVHDPEASLSAFRDGILTDSANVTLYLGADQALSLLNRPASERVAVLEKYSSLKDAPSSLIFELILNLTEASDFEQSEALFRGRFFPREEGGTNVRQVWIEVQLQKILALTKGGKCPDALTAADRLGAEVPGLDFTHDGMEPFLQSARTNYFLGTVYANCGKPAAARLKYQSASTGSAPDQVLWAWLAAKKLPGVDEKQWQERLRVALAQAKNRSETSSYTSWWDYSAGLLARALGNKQEAEENFEKAILLPDRMMSYHFTRLAAVQSFPSIQ